MKNASFPFLFRKDGLPFLFSALSVFFSLPALAQQRLSLKVRPGIAFATTEVFEADIHSGLGFEGTVSYRFMPHLYLYGGWGWDSFTATESFAGEDVHFEETGYVMGFQFIHPMGNDLAFEYFARGGLIIGHIEVESKEGKMLADSGHGGGFQVEAGLFFPLGGRWHLIPGVKYQTLSREIIFESLQYPIDLNFLSVGVSISCSF